MGGEGRGANITKRKKKGSYIAVLIKILFDLFDF